LNSNLKQKNKFLQTSSLQVFLDRRIDQDDNRGMEQAMNDNIVTSNKFLILFDSLNNAPGKDTTNSNVMMLKSRSLLFYH